MARRDRGGGYARAHACGAAARRLPACAVAAPAAARPLPSRPPGGAAPTRPPCLQFGGEDLDPSTSSLWFAGKQLAADKKLADYLGRNERTKAVVKLQKKGAGPPAREPVSARLLRGSSSRRRRDRARGWAVLPLRAGRRGSWLGALGGADVWRAGLTRGALLPRPFRWWMPTHRRP